MNIKKLKFENYGPIKNFEYIPIFKENGDPKPLVIIGKNGSGKTLMLSSILDSLIEIKRKKYDELPEVDSNKYIKVGKKDYIKSGENYSSIEIDYENEGFNAQYSDLMSNLPFEQFKRNHPELTSPALNDNRFQQNGFYKNCHIPNNDFLKAFENKLISFFPHSRYDHPAWLNKDTNIGFTFNETFVDQSSKSIIKSDVIKEVETWILDCLLDREIYEKQMFQLPQGQQLFRGYSGKNNDIINLINELLGIIYKSKFPNLQYARIGIGAKNRRNISVLIKEINGEEFQISPSFSHLSSGEAMLLSLFTALLKEYDELGNQVRNLNQLKGIVIIDEIDLHLHIEFQKTILPRLLKRFSKVQFILTSHSPFFLYGMEEVFGKEWSLINLPYGNEIELHDFSEMKNAYNIFVKGFNDLQKTFTEVNKKLQSITKPIVITKGKTDWMHLKNALKIFQEKEEFNDLNFQFLEYENEIQMGDSHLKSLCEQTSKLDNKRKVICIFDRDDKKIIKEMSGNGEAEFKKWGNSVYSFCIPKPSFRNEYNNISIEFYYRDEEIKQIDKETGKRLFFTNELEEIIIKSKTTNKVKTRIEILEEPKLEEEHDKKIYCEDVPKIKNLEGHQVAHSKSVFANNILTQKDDFKNFEIEEFRKIFDVIKQILN